MAANDTVYYQDVTLTGLAAQVDPLTTGTAPTHGLVTEPILEGTLLRGKLYMQALTELP